MIESGSDGAPSGSPAAASPPGAPSRVVVGEAEAGALSAAEWGARWRLQDAYVASLERRLGQQEGELEEMRQATDRVRTQFGESQQRERLLIRRLTAKEQEMQDYVCQLNELKSAQAASAATLRSTLIDPSVNCVLQHLKTELAALRSKLDDTQNEMSAWKFTPDSNTGKRLMAKCHLLYQENEELGKITTSGRIAKLETDLALQKSFSEEVRQSQNELDSFLADLDEDVEAMQSTILLLQTELRKAQEMGATLARENAALAQQQQQQLANGRSNGSVCGGEGGERTESSPTDSERTNCVKRVRRSSVLSIEYEDDALGISANGDVTMASDPE